MMDESVIAVFFCCSHFLSHDTYTHLGKFFSKYGRLVDPTNFIKSPYCDAFLFIQCMARRIIKLMHFLSVYL